MDDNNINQQNMEQQDDIQTQEPVEEQSLVQEEKSMGAVLGSIIVVIILLVAAFYLWGNQQETPDPIEEPTVTAEEVLQAEDPQTEMLEKQGDSDGLNMIEQDLEDTDFEDLTEELDAIDSELGL